MSEGTGSTVECPVCGEQFNPTAAGGWCTNPDCGEWQHKGDDPAAQNGEPADDADTGPDPGEENIAETDPADTGSEDTETPGEGSERPEVNPPSESVDDSPVDDGSAVEEPLLDDEGGDAATHGGPAGAGSEEEVPRSGSGDLSGSESGDGDSPSGDAEDGEVVDGAEDAGEDAEAGASAESASAESASVEDSTDSGADPEEDDAWGAFEPADAGEHEGSESNATEDTAVASVSTTGSVPNRLSRSPTKRKPTPPSSVAAISENVTVWEAAYSARRRCFAPVCWATSTLPATVNPIPSEMNR